LARSLPCVTPPSCSIVRPTRWRRPAGSRASAAPRMAALSLSVPPLFKTISDGSAMFRSTSRVRGSSMDGSVLYRLGLLPEVMDNRRFAVILSQGGRHRVHARGSHGRCGVVVQVDAVH